MTTLTPEIKARIALKGYLLWAASQAADQRERAEKRQLTTMGVDLTGRACEMVGEFDTLMQHYDTLLARCDALEADAKRIDWLDKCDLGALHNVMGMIADGNATRYVIDAAMQEKPWSR